MVRRDQEQIAEACAIARRSSARKHLSDVTPVAAQEMAARSVGTALALAVILGAEDECVDPAVAQHMFQGEDAASATAPAVRNCEAKLDALVRKDQLPQPARAAMESLSQEGISLGSIVSEPDKVARLFNTSWATVIFARFVARELERGTQKLSNSIPWAPGLAQAILERIVAEFYAMAVHALVDDLEQSHRIDRAEVSAAACEIIAEGNYDSTIANVVTKRLALRILDYSQDDDAESPAGPIAATTAQSGSDEKAATCESGWAKWGRNAKSRVYATTGLCEELHSYGSGVPLEFCSRVRARVDPWRKDTQTGEERSSMRRARSESRSKFHRWVREVKRASRFEGHDARSSARMEIGAARSALKAKDANVRARWRELREPLRRSRLRTHKDVAPSLSTEYSLPRFDSAPRERAVARTAVLAEIDSEFFGKPAVRRVRDESLRSFLAQGRSDTEVLRVLLDGKVDDLRAGFRFCGLREGTCVPAVVSLGAGLNLAHRVGIVDVLRETAGAVDVSSYSCDPTYWDLYNGAACRPEAEAVERREEEEGYRPPMLSFSGIQIGTEIQARWELGDVLVLERSENVEDSSLGWFDLCESKLNDRGELALNELLAFTFHNRAEIEDVVFVGNWDEKPVSKEECTSKYPGNPDQANRDLAEDRAIYTGERLCEAFRDSGYGDIPGLFARRADIDDPRRRAVGMFVYSNMGGRPGRSTRGLAETAKSIDPSTCKVIGGRAEP